MIVDVRGVSVEIDDIPLLCEVDLVRAFPRGEVERGSLEPN